MPTPERRDPPSLEARVLALEGSRYGTIGRINALTTMLLTLWADYLHKQPGDALEALEKQRALWLLGAESPPPRRFQGADPAHLQLASQEYQEALVDLTDLLLADARRRKQETKLAPTKAKRTRARKRS